MISTRWLAAGSCRPLALAVALVALASSAHASAQSSTQARDSAEPILRFTADPRQESELCIRIDDDRNTRTIELRLSPAPVVISTRSGSALRPVTEPLGQHEPHWASRISTPTFALSAGAVSMLALGIGLGVRGRVELERYNSRCSEQTCSESAGTRGKRLYIATDVSLALSAGFTIAALWSYFARDAQADRAPSRLRRSLPEVSLGAKRGLLVWGSTF